MTKRDARRDTEAGRLKANEASRLSRTKHKALCASWTHYVLLLGSFRQTDRRMAEQSFVGVDGQTKSIDTA